jgi:hypothetical protein
VVPELAQVVVLVAAQVVVRPVVALLAVVRQPVVRQPVVQLQAAQLQPPVRQQLQLQQRLVWWRLVLPLWLWWLLRWLRKMKQPRQVLPHPHPLPLPLPLQHNNYPAVIKRPNGAFFYARNPGWVK